MRLCNVLNAGSDLFKNGDSSKNMNANGHMARKQNGALPVSLMARLILLSQLQPVNRRLQGVVSNVTGYYADAVGSLSSYERSYLLSLQ